MALATCGKIKTTNWMALLDARWFRRIRLRLTMRQTQTVYKQRIESVNFIHKHKQRGRVGHSNMKWRRETKTIFVAFIRRQCVDRHSCQWRRPCTSTECRGPKRIAQITHRNDCRLSNGLSTDTEERNTENFFCHSHWRVAVDTDTSVYFIGILHCLRRTYCDVWKWREKNWYLLDAVGLLFVSDQCVAAWHPNAVRFIVLQQSHFLPDQRLGWYLYDFGLFVSSQTEKARERKKNS